MANAGQHSGFLPSQRGGLNLTAELFSCVQWLFGDLRELLENIDLQTSKFKSSSGIAAHHAVQNILDSEVHHYASACSVLVEEHPCVCSYIVEQIVQRCRQVAEEVNTSLHVEFLSFGCEFKRVFGLDDDDIAICEFIYIIHSFSEVKNYFDIRFNIFNVSNRRMMAQTLSIQQDVLSVHISMLHSFGIIEYLPDHSLGLTEMIKSFWSSELSFEEGYFCSKFCAELLPLKSFHRTDEELRHVSRLLKEQVDFPVNFLIYGPSGAGKKTFIHSLARTLNMQVWFVSSRDKRRDSEYRASFFACLHRASKQKESIIVVDGAERLLHIVFSSDTDIISFLKRIGQKIVWITDEIEKIDPAFRSYFTYSMYFEALGLHERIEMWRNVMKRQGLSRRFHKSSITKFSLKYPVKVNIVESSVVQEAGLYPVGRKFYDAIDRILYAYLRFQSRGSFQHKKIIIQFQILH